MNVSTKVRGIQDIEPFIYLSIYLSKAKAKAKAGLSMGIFNSVYCVCMYYILVMI